MKVLNKLFFGVAMLLGGLFCSAQAMNKNILVQLKQATTTTSLQSSGLTRDLARSCHEKKSMLIPALLHKNLFFIHFALKNGERVTEEVLKEVAHKVDFIGVLKLLKQVGADIRMYFFDAVKNGNLDVVAWFLDNRFNVNYKTTWQVNGNMSFGVSGLHLAVESGNQKMVELLFNYGADVNVCDMGSYTPLHCAVLKGDVDMVKLLLQHYKINPSIKNCNENTPLACVYLFSQQQEIKNNVELSHRYTKIIKILNDAIFERKIIHERCDRNMKRS